MSVWSQIYNEVIRDLLNPSSGFLDLREDSRGSIQIAGITEVSTSNAQEVRGPCPAHRAGLGTRPRAVSQLRGRQTLHPQRLGADVGARHAQSPRDCAPPPRSPRAPAWSVSALIACSRLCPQIMQLLTRGNRQRTQEPTATNKTSSRSHAVLQVTVRQQRRGAALAEQVRLGRLFMVDLAGSERASQVRPDAPPAPCSPSPPLAFRLGAGPCPPVSNGIASAYESTWLGEAPARCLRLG